MNEPYPTVPGPSLASTLLILFVCVVAGIIGWTVLLTFGTLFTRFCVFVIQWAWHVHIPFTR